MVGTAHHLFIVQSFAVARSNNCLHDRLCGVRRFIGIHLCLCNRYATASMHPIAHRTHMLHHALASVWIGIAYIQLQLHTARHTVHGARMHTYRSYGCYGVDRASRKRTVLYSENNLCCSAESILPVRHQQSSSVPTKAFNRYTIACRRGNLRNNTDRHSLTLQKGSLLNMQLHPCAVVVLRQANIFKSPCEPSLGANFL